MGTRFFSGAGSFLCLFPVVIFGVGVVVAAVAAATCDIARRVSPGENPSLLLVISPLSFSLLQVATRGPGDSGCCCCRRRSGCGWWWSMVSSYTKVAKPVFLCLATLSIHGVVPEETT